MRHPFPWKLGLLLIGSGWFFLVESMVRLPAQDANGSGFSNYQNTPVSSILDIYEQLSGKHLVRDVNLNGVPPVSINATGLSKAEMLKLIEATLLLNGVAIVPVDDHTAKVVVTQSKNPRNEGTRLYANEADLPVNDEVVSYYMPLNYLNPADTQTIFTQQAPVHTYGAYVPVPSAQAIVLTENSSVIRQLIALKELIDVPPAHVTSEFIQLQRADADKTAELLNKLISGNGDQAGLPAAAAATSSASPRDLGAPDLNEHHLISGTAQIVSDERSNRLLVVTRPTNMPFLKQLITELDEEDSFMVPQRRDLKYVMAGDILPALEAALAEGKDQDDQAKQDATKTPSTTAAAASAPSAAGSLSNGGQGTVSAVTPALSAPTENNIPSVVQVGKTRILADNRSNSIIVFGTPDSTERVFGMIDQLDRKPLQVYLATVIGELQVGNGLDFGIDILQKFQHVGSYGLATGVVTPGTTQSAQVPEPGGLLSSLGFPLPTGLTLYGAIGNTLNAYVRALETTNRFKIISRPSVYTTNNKLAVIASGSQVPVPSNTTSGFTGSDTLATTSSITYEDVLLQLSIIPLINADHQVTLKIRQTNNTLGGTTEISGNAIPSINTQEINTEVTIPDKSTVVIGGLISDNTTRSTSGIPFLSDIPLLGYFFKETQKSKTRNELIIMIQPTVVATDADQISSTEAEKRRTILGVEADEAATSTVPSDDARPIKKVITQTTTYTSPDAKSSVSTSTTTVTPNAASGPSLRSLPLTTPTPSPDVSSGRLPKDAPGTTPTTPP